MHLSSQLLSLLLIDAINRGDFDNAEKYVETRFNIVKEQIKTRYGSLNEDERIAMVSSGVTTPIDIAHMLTVNPTENVKCLAYDAALFYKNLLLESSNQIRNKVYHDGRTQTIQLYERLNENRKRLQSFNISDDESEKVFVELRREINAMEDSLYQQIPSLKNLDLKRETRWRDVANSLKTNEAAIEFIKTPTGYGALVLRNKYSCPQFVNLISDSLLTACFDTNHLDQTHVRQMYLRGGTRATRNNRGDMLYDNLWKPIEDFLQGINTVYFCPTGGLNGLQFAALCDSANNTLCEKYDLRMVSSTANITFKDFKKKRNLKNSKVTLIGAVQYEADGIEENPQHRNWAHLPQSIIELENIEKLCDDNAGLIVKEKRIGTGASEKWFRTLSGDSPEILLLSTHGFYLNSKDASTNLFYINKKMTNDSIPNRAISPLMRGGIVLSGANVVWNNEQEVPDDQDGILTGYEISELDLSNTKMLVLSACQTGMGEPTMTEGVNGLQRGFKIGGVGTIIMSLWEVNDLAGQKFMKEFFERITSGMEEHEAFRHTQIALKQEYPREPFMWAPFVMLD